jgi:FkbM family methyltransferase
MQLAQFDYRGVPIKLFVHDNEYISNVIRYQQTFFELPILEWVAINFPQQRTVLDIGANIGNHAYYFRRFVRLERLVCFEPFPPNYELLQRNLGEAAELLPVALGSSERTVGMRFNPENMGICVIDDEIPGNIQIKTLDSYYFENVTLIKMDVEVHHVDVVKGMLDTVKRCRPILLLEGNFDELFPMIQEFGYACIAFWKIYNTYCFVPLTRDR